jgi:hypothetical protein
MSRASSDRGVAMAETDPPARPGGRSARRQRAPKRPDEDKPVSGYEGSQTRVRLTGGEADPDQVREALRSFFGEHADAELGERVAKLQPYEERILQLAFRAARRAGRVHR